MWKCGSGYHELKFVDFVKQVELFRDSFFEKMDAQVASAIQKEWGAIELDKENLIREHAERREDFHRSLSVLKGEIWQETNWTEILDLYDGMQSELNATEPRMSDRQS